MPRYATLLLVQLRASTAVGMQYRVDFLVQGAISFLFAFVTLVPLRAVFSAERATVAGWSYAEALLVLAWFTLLKSVLDGAVHPSLIAVVEHIRKGTLDFVLIKPADAQFLVSTAKLELWKVVDAVAAFVMFGYAFVLLGRLPAPEGFLQAGLLLVVAVLVLYSLWILVICAAFHVVRLDNLSHLFVSIFDVARWPISVFNGVLRFVFTFVIPLALMTTYPALALLGKLEAATCALAVAGGLAFTALARIVWLFSLSSYTSASS